MNGLFLCIITPLHISRKLPTAKTAKTTAKTTASNATPQNNHLEPCKNTKYKKHTNSSIMYLYNMIYDDNFASITCTVHLHLAIWLPSI